ncbi:MAG: DUF6335 family protein [Acidobacteriota bacterium]
MAKKDRIRVKDADQFIHQASTETFDEEVVQDLKDEQKKEYASHRFQKKLRQHHSKSPQLSGGDVDAAWDQAEVGERSVGGDNATPDQDVVEELGKALGVTYQDTEPLQGSEKIRQRDEERWELDPASSEDFAERNKRKP